jgi:hypothetical protein
MQGFLSQGLSPRDMNVDVLAPAGEKTLTKQEDE